MSNAQPQVVTLSIRIGGEGSHPYKSITQLEWNDIPPFAVLTGLNGSGKTQLLELLAHKLVGVQRSASGGDLAYVKVSIEGTSFAPDEVAYLPSRWNLSNPPALGLAQMQQAKQQLWSDFRHYREEDFVLRARRGRLQRLIGEDLSRVSFAEFDRRLPDDFVYMLEESDITSGLAHIFLAYRLRTVEELERGSTGSEIVNKLGPAPWDVLNQTLAVSGFPYRVSSPVGTRLLENYYLQFEDMSTGTKLQTSDLSSGETVLLGLVLWLYSSQHHGRFPKLMLLDEPDAHLHPSMTQQFIDVVREVLVEHYGVRVILTTHSPSTVALTPDDALFEMSREVPRIRKSSSKAHTIGLLTAGLVIVGQATRMVLVEDSADVDFYNVVRDVLSDYGPSRDQMSLAPTPSIAFLAASSGSGNLKTGGGKNAVRNWIEKFDSPPLDEVFRGIIDRDINNLPSARVEVIGRYSIENYILDPLVVFGVLLDQGTAPTIDSISVTAGDEHRLRTMPSHQLQSIVDAICSRVEPMLAGLTTMNQQRVEVFFTNGTTLFYPDWVLTRRGHDLMPVLQQVFGGPGIISVPRLLRSMRRVRLIPRELGEVLARLQAGA